jgi:Zn-dependent protease
MRQSVSIGRISGIDVRIHVSWLLAFAFVTWGLGSGYFRFILPREQGLAFPLVLGAISALLLFASVLIHEFSHSLVAQALGMRVRDITLFIFGGVSNIGGDVRSPRDEFLISAVGPLTSFLLAGLFWLLGRGMATPSAFDVLFGSLRTLRAMTPLGAILTYLTAINLLLGAFNLIPAFPLDGGRVFRSIVWGITRRYGRATAIATIVGQTFGVLMIGLGVVRFVLGDLMGGVWTIIIGWFLVQAAGAARQDRVLRDGLQGVPVSSVMDTGVPLVEASMTLDRLIDEHLLRSDRRRSIAVENGAPRGIVEASAVHRVPREAWSSTPVAVVMLPIAMSVPPEADASEVLARLSDRLDLIPVVSDGRVVGAIDLARLLHFAQMRRELQVQVSSAKPSTA